MAAHELTKDEFKALTANLNAGEPWWDLAIRDLRFHLDNGYSVAYVAEILCRPEDEVRAKARELGYAEEQLH